MAEDDSCGARLLQHFRRDITGMGSRRRGVTVLAGQHQPASPDGRRQRRYQRCRRGDHNVGADRREFAVQRIAHDQGLGQVAF